MTTISVPDMATARKCAPLDDRGVMLATSALQLHLYRVLGEHLDRETAYRMAVCICQEYLRGTARHAAALNGGQ